MKFFIFFMLVGLGHCLGDVPGAVKCTKKLLAASPDFVDAALKEACALKGDSTDEEKKEAVDKINSQIEIVAKETSCATEELLELDIEETVEDTSKGTNNVIINVDELLTSIGLTKEVLAFTCKLTDVVIDSECYDNALKILKSSVKDLTTDPAGNILRELKCQAEKGIIDLETFGNLLVDGECLDLVPDLVVSMGVACSLRRQFYIATLEINWIKDPSDLFTCSGSIKRRFRSLTAMLQLREKLLPVQKV
ncbi:uncharacterized protein [Hyperolius riggenbachi]|uniref:uncharacterized protein isoform X3 n=1 Tax=Hyperolius riggenbachi TaxID=752182 RepID=UPI0035A26EE2